MSIAQRLVNLSDGLTADGVLSTAKGGTGTTTGASVPTISAIGYGGDDTATNPAGGATITLTGTNFASGAKVLINTTPVSVVTVVSATQITFTAPALAAGSYILYVVNLDGSTAIAVPGIQYSGVPAWTTAAGSLGTGYETAAVSTTVSATSDSAVSYSVVSGTLPSGVVINSTGTISGTSPLVAGSTTYTFTVRATDAEKQDTDRQFSLTVNPDVVVWSSSNTITLSQDVASTTTLAATSAAGKTVSYSVNTLPAGLTLSGATVSGTATTAGTTTTTATATAAVTGKTAQQTITWTVSIAADTYFPYTTLLLNAETSVQPFLADASTNNFALTAFGDTRASNFSPYVPIASSVYFNGSSDYLTSSGNATIATGEFTIEAWIYPTSFNASNTVLDNSLWNIGQNGGYTFYIDSTGKVALGGSTGVWNSSTTWLTSTSSVVTNRWQHVAITRDSSNVIRCFINGVLDPTTTTYAASLNLSTAGGITTNISRTVADGGTYNYFAGYISNVHAANGTGACKYITAFTPSVYPIVKTATTVFLACNSRRLVDASTNAFTLTAGGSAAVNNFNPFLNNPSYANYGSAYFDGSGDYLKTTSTGAAQFGTGDFTVELWVHLTSIPAATALIDFRAANGASFGQVYVTTAGVLRLYLPTDVGTTNTIPLNAWTHLAITRSSGTVQMFINGVSGYSGTQPGALNSGALSIGAAFDGTAPVNGYISNVRFITGTALYTANFTPPATPLTAVTNTSLLTCQTNQPHTNSQFLDNSTSAVKITRAGNATQGAFSPYGANWSTYFDGSGDYLSIPNNAAFNQNSAFTVECWVYATLGGYFYTQLNNGFLCLNYTGDTRRIQVDKSYIGVQINSTNTFAFHQWHHVAMSYDGTTTRLFVNGALEGSVAGGGAASGTDTQIGAYAGGSNFNGYISNFRVSNAALYTSAFTPSTQPLTALSTTKFLTCQQANSVDSSMSALAITRNGDVSVQRFSPFATVTQTPQTHSVYLGGQAVATLSPASTNFNLTGDFTLEAWVYITALPGGTWGIFDARASGATAASWLFSISGAGKSTLFEGTERTGTTTLTLNTWHHVAWTRSGSVLRGYLNGVLDYYNGSYGTVALSPGSTSPVIGTKDYGISAAWGTTGYISNLRIINGTAVYTTSSTTVGTTIFTAPTQPLTAVAGTALLACQDSTLRDNSTNAYTLTPTGTARPRQQNPFGYTTSSAQDYTPATFGGSAYFDGSGDYLDVPHSSNQWIGLNQDFTIECWFYITGGSGERTLIAKGYQGSPAYAEFGIVINSSNQLLGIVSSSGGSWLATPTDTVAISNNTWNHVALVRSGTTITLYRNGVAAVTATNVGAALYNHTGTIRVGQHSSGSNFTGYISDARVVIGTALYTANFVPPSAPLTAVQNTTLLLNMDRAAISDKSGEVVAETVGDTRLSSAVKKYGNSSMYFDGTGDYLNIYNPSYTLSVGSGDFTFECWINVTSLPGTVTALYHLKNDSALSTTVFILELTPSGAISLSSGTALITSGTAGKVTTGTWIHFACVRTSGVIKTFFNGVQDISTANTNTYNGTYVQIGAWRYSGYDYSFNGYIDDLRITKGYARYTANFTPPAQALLTK